MNRTTRANERPANWAEFLLECGRIYRVRMRRGAGTGEASRQLLQHPRFCRLALEFAGSSDVLKLRAMVEDWPLARICQELSCRTRHRTLAVVMRDGSCSATLLFPIVNGSGSSPCD